MSTDPSFFVSAFGKNLKRSRIRTGRSLRYVAKTVGISSSFLSAIERGRRMPSAIVLEKIAAILRIPAAELASHDHRQFLKTITMEVRARPANGPVLLKICERLRTGQISRDDLERLIQ